MKKYVLIFAVTYLSLTVALAVLTEMLNVGGGTGFNIVVTIAASFISAWRFTKEQDRIPTAEENASFARTSLASVWLTSLILVVLFFAFIMSPTDIDEFKRILVTKTFLIVAAVGSIIFSAIYYFVIKWSFSWYAKQSFNE